MTTRRAIGLAMLLAALCAATTASANPFDTFGAGTRAIGMGGAYTAVSDDISGLYYNPGALIQMSGLDIELAYHHASPRLRLAGHDIDSDENSGVQFGLLLTQRLAGRRLAFGANVFLPDDHVIRFQMLPRRQAQYVMFTNDNHVLVVDAGGGYEIIEGRLGLGAALSVVGDNTGGVDLTLREDEPSAGSLDTKLKLIARPIVGIWGRPAPAWRVGFCYREKTDVKLDLPNNIHVPELGVFEDNRWNVLAESEITLIARSYSHFSPRAFALGVAFDALPRTTITLDETWRQWSQYHDPTVRLKLRIDGGLGQIVDIERQPPLESADFHDIFVTALGVEGRPIERPGATLAVRGGYIHSPSPAPRQSGAMNLIDTTTNTVSAGVGFTAKDPLGAIDEWSLNAYGRVMVLRERTVEKTSADDPVGDYTVGGYVPGFGASLTAKF